MELLQAADRLEAEGRRLEAVDLLQEANRTLGEPTVERRLVALRHRAHPELLASAVPPRPSTAGSGAAAAPASSDGVPTVAAADLTAAAIRSGIDAGGCLLVRGLVPQPRVDQLVDDIDRAITGFEAFATGEPPDRTAPWFEELVAGDRYGSLRDGTRRTVHDGGGALTADSPRALFDLVETMRETGVLAAATGFLGERPAMSWRKSTLRKVPTTAVHASWHQDGAFLGTPIRTLNVWMALTDCGDDAPTMDILPKRLDGIVETGTEGSIFGWATAHDKVLEAADGVPIRRPRFRAGDALLFDELFLHRTACEPGMTRERYAVETWLFAPSAVPDGQVPLVV